MYIFMFEILTTLSTAKIKPHPAISSLHVVLADDSIEN